MKYKLTLAFDGSAFSGWQAQKNAPTVQAELTRAAKLVFGPDATVTGASRTDSKVHALGFVCHVSCQKKLFENAVVMALNHTLDPHIAVLDAEEVCEDFHARYSAVSKEYHYVIYTSPVPDPFLLSRAWHYPHTLDERVMSAAASELVGEHDFSSFMAAGSKIVDPVRTIYRAEVVKEDNCVIFKVLGNGFLYNMVRIITGTLVDIERGSIKKSVSDIILARDRQAAGRTAPAEGLYLYKVNY